MAKSAKDATRFTPTTPHASSKPPSSPPPLPRHRFPNTSIPSTSSSTAASPLPNRAMPLAPPGETPQEKVRRLRAAALRAREAQVSGLDRFLVRGRVWADRAHRFTALSLIGISAIAGVITVYAFGDMAIHNRRKKREYFAEQKALEEQAAYEAYLAVRNGSATEEQVMLVRQEEMEREMKRAAVEQVEEAKREPWTARGKKWLFGGLKMEDDVGAERGQEVGDGGAVMLGEREKDGTVRESMILRAVEERNAEKRRGNVAEGGGGGEATADQWKTDVAASELSSAEPPKQGGGWTSFMSRR